MTGQASTHDLDAPIERVLPFSLDSCIRIVVSSGQSEGIAPWPANADEGLPRLSALSVLAFCQVPTQLVITFNTADMGGGHLRLDEEHQLLEDARAYLQCMAQDVEPDSYHRGAWERFFFAYTYRIHRVAQDCGLSQADTDDCAQEVWLVILDVLRRAGGEPQWGQFSRWMHGLIRNRVATFVRGLARRPERERQTLVDAVHDCDLGPAASYEQNEWRHLVRHALADLKQQVSATNYRIVHLRWIEGREVAAVAAQLDLTSEQVRYRHHRVKKQLRRLLECHGARWE